MPPESKLTRQCHPVNKHIPPLGLDLFMILQHYEQQEQVKEVLASVIRWCFRWRHLGIILDILRTSSLKEEVIFIIPDVRATEGRHISQSKR